MTAVPRTPDDTARLQALYEAKVRSELAAADGDAPGSDSVPSSGDLFADILALKGAPGPAESAGDPVLSGPDGAALTKALEALVSGGLTYFATLSRPEPDVPAKRRARRVRSIIEAIDPPLVLALDAVAAEDVALAFGLASFGFGAPKHAGGRELLAVDGLEASLCDPARKKRVWRQLKCLGQPGPLL